MIHFGGSVEKYISLKLDTIEISDFIDLSNYQLIEYLKSIFYDDYECATDVIKFIFNTNLLYKVNVVAYELSPDISCNIDIIIFVYDTYVTFEYFKEQLDESESRKFSMYLRTMLDKNVLYKILEKCFTDNIHIIEYINRYIPPQNLVKKIKDKIREVVNTKIAGKYYDKDVHIYNKIFDYILRKELS